MDFVDNIEDLQQAAYKISIRNSLRILGVLGIVFGSVVLIGGLIAPDSSAGGSLVFLLAAVLLSAGIWGVAAPSPAAIAAVSVMIGFVGVVNIADALTGRGSYFWLALGVLQIYLAYVYFLRYRRYSRLITTRKPTPEALNVIQQLYNRVWSSKAADGPYVIEYTVIGQRWRAWLMEDTAISVFCKGEAIVLALKRDVAISPQSAARAADKVNVLVQIGGSKDKAVISAEHLQRYETWRATPTGREIVTASSDRPAT